jgi:hypothetical protein
MWDELCDGLVVFREERPPERDKIKSTRGRSDF